MRLFPSRHTRRPAGVAGAVAIVLLAAGCTAAVPAGSLPDAARIKGGVAVVPYLAGAGADYIFPFAPDAYYTTGNFQDFIYLMHRPLYLFGGNNSSVSLNIRLSLAKTPVYSADGRTVTITMKGWRWSDGETVDARDVIFWLNLDRAEKASFAGYTPGGIPDNVLSYRATGPDTVVLRLSQKYSSIWFTYNELAQIDPMPMAWDVTRLRARPGSGGCATDSARDRWAKCKKVFSFLTAQARDSSSYATSPIWSVVDGPWKLASYRPDGGYAFVPNPSYSGAPKPSIAELRFQGYGSAAAIYAALRKNALSVGQVPAADLPRKPLSQPVPSRNPLGAAYYLQPAYTFGISYFQVNYHNPSYGPVFGQLYFRQALQLLADQDRMSRTINRGYAYPTSSGVPILPPSQWVSSDMVANAGAGLYAYNPARAHRLLARHGWSTVGGVLACTRPGSGARQCGPGVRKGLQAKLTLDYAAGDPMLSQEVQAYRSDLASAGIELSAAARRPAAMLGLATACSGQGCTWQMLFGSGWTFSRPGYEPTGEPLFLTGAQANAGSYSDARMDRLVARTQTSSSVIAMHSYANYTAIQVPSEWMPQAYAVEAVSSKLRGVAQNPLLMFYPEYWSFVK